MEIELLIVSVILGLLTIFFVSSFVGTSFFMHKSQTMPVGSYPKLVLGEGFVGAETKALNHQKIVEKAKEGFYGGAANGAGEPSCLRTLADAAAVYDEISMRVSGEQGPKDLAEFKLLLSKWACLKKDLMSPSGIVDATRMLPYSTLHDRIPVPDIAGQCNAKTIPKRDLDITFDTWKQRARYLFRRLAAGANITNAEAAALEKRLMNAWSDVYNVATSQCLTSTPSGKMSPRDAAPRTPDELVDLGTYSGYY